jgi:hypothetical protein
MGLLFDRFKVFVLQDEKVMEKDGGDAYRKLLI